MAASGFSPAAITLTGNGGDIDHSLDQALPLRQAQAPKLPSATVTSKKEGSAKKVENATKTATAEEEEYPYVEYVSQYDAQGVLLPVMKPSKTSGLTRKSDVLFTGVAS